MAYAVPILTGLTTPVTFLENAVNAAPQLIDADVTLHRLPTITNFNGGTLTVTGLLAEDTVAIRNQGTAPARSASRGEHIGCRSADVPSSAASRAAMAARSPSPSTRAQLRRRSRR